MEEFFIALANKVLSEMGIAVALLLCAIVYLVRELKSERADRKAMWDARSTQQEKQTEASLATATAMLDMKNAIERLSERIR